MQKVEYFCDWCHAAIPVERAKAAKSTAGVSANGPNGDFVGSGRSKSIGARTTYDASDEGVGQRMGPAKYGGAYLRFVLTSTSRMDQDSQP